MANTSIFNWEVCKDCTAWARRYKNCPYRYMSLTQYLDYKNIPYDFKEAGRKIVIDTSNLMNSSAMIELNKEIERTNNKVLESGYDYKIVV